MAYKIIRKEECNFIDENLSLLRYQILERHNIFYLQLKVKNISQKTISSFKIIYKINNKLKEYPVNYIAKPEEEFLSKTLIQIDNTNFEFLGFLEVNYQEENVETNINSTSLIENSDNHEKNNVKKETLIVESKSENDDFKTKSIKKDNIDTTFKNDVINFESIKLNNFESTEEKKVNNKSNDNFNHPKNSFNEKSIKENSKPTYKNNSNLDNTLIHRNEYLTKYKHKQVKIAVLVSIIILSIITGIIVFVLYLFTPIFTTNNNNSSHEEINTNYSFKGDYFVSDNMSNNASLKLNNDYTFLLKSDDYKFNGTYTESIDKGLIFTSNNNIIVSSTTCSNNHCQIYMLIKFDEFNYRKIYCFKNFYENCPKYTAPWELNKEEYINLNNMDITNSTFEYKMYFLDNLFYICNRQGEINIAGYTVINNNNDYNKKSLLFSWTTDDVTYYTNSSIQNINITININGEEIQFINNNN